MLSVVPLSLASGLSSAFAPGATMMPAASAAAKPQRRPRVLAVARIPQGWRLCGPDTVVISVKRHLRKGQRGETWLAPGLVCVDPSPRVGRSALRIIGCDKDPRMETRGGVSVLSCEAFNGAE